MVLYDWQRGKIPFFSLPAGHTADKPKASDAMVRALTSSITSLGYSVGIHIQPR